MARASYDTAINWIVEMDDNEWVPDYPASSPSVTACLVRDIFQKEEEQVVEDIRKEQRRLRRAEKKTTGDT